MLGHLQGSHLMHIATTGQELYRDHGVYFILITGIRFTHMTQNNAPKELTIHVASTKGFLWVRLCEKKNYLASKVLRKVTTHLNRPDLWWERNSRTVTLWRTTKMTNSWIKWDSSTSNWLCWTWSYSVGTVWRSCLTIWASSMWVSRKTHNALFHAVTLLH